MYLFWHGPMGREQSTCCACLMLRNDGVSKYWCCWL